MVSNLPYKKEKINIKKDNGMTNGRLNNTLKERAIRLEEEGAYQDARDKEFTTQFRDMFFNNGYLSDISEDDIRIFVDSFSFKSEEDWISDEVESEYGGYCDQAYEQAKDERMGL